MESKLTEGPQVRIDCDDTVLQNRVLNRHSITAADYARMIDDFFPNEIADAKPHNNIQQLRDQVHQLDCNQFKIRIEADDTDTGTNGDIMFGFEEKMQEVVVNYSIVLFRALFRVHEPDQIFFSKAISINAAGEEKPDIVFKAMRGGEAVYYGDLSDVLP